MREKQSYNELVAPAANFDWTELRMIKRRPVCVIRTRRQVLIAPLKSSHKIFFFFALQVANVIDLPKTSPQSGVNKYTRMQAHAAIVPAHVRMRLHSIFSEHSGGLEQMPKLRAVCQNPTVRVHPVVAPAGDIDVRIILEANSDGDGWIYMYAQDTTGKFSPAVHTDGGTRQYCGLTARGLLGTKVQGFERSQVILNQTVRWSKSSPMQQHDNLDSVGEVYRRRGQSYAHLRHLVICAVDRRAENHS
eukprot:COSAG02_NODE_961_length_15629_cov_2.747650_14_plen_247_part_00